MHSQKKLIILALLVVGLFPFRAFPEVRKFVLITDMEPDDRVALHVFGYYLVNDSLGLAGSALLNSERKRVLLERTIRDLGFLDADVQRGSGGTKDDYPNIASSLQAREYQGEGKNILTERQLAQLQRAPMDGNPFQNALESYLSNNHDVELVVMSAPTDLIAVLQKRPELKKRIKRIHVMGGWTKDKKGQLRTTFNWNMGHLASKVLLSLSREIPIRIYSSDMIKKSIAGGSVSRKNMPELMSRIEVAKSNLRGLQDLEVASRSWDEGIIKKVPELKDIIGVENIGRQFTPADVILAMSIFAQERLEKHVRKVDVHLDLEDLDPSRGFAVRVVPSEESTIELVEEIDVEFFEKELSRVFTYLPSVVENRVRRFRIGQRQLRSLEIASHLQADGRTGIYVASIGQNTNYIRTQLAKFNPEEVFLIVDPSMEYSLDFARQARRANFKVVGLTTKQGAESADGFIHYDEFYLAKNRGELVRALYRIGKKELRLDRPIGEEIYISFHTHNQSLQSIERTLSTIAKHHPGATLVHGFLPRSQIHYLPGELKKTVIDTLDLFDRYFPDQLRVRDRYVGLGDTRQEMANRASRNRSSVYVVGEVSGGVAEEVLTYLHEGVTPISIGVGETNIRNTKELSYSNDCMRPYLHLGKVYTARR